MKTILLSLLFFSSIVSASEQTLATHMKQSIRVERHGEFNTFQYCNANNCDLLGERAYSNGELQQLSINERKQANKARNVAVGVAASAVILTFVAKPLFDLLPSKFETVGEFVALAMMIPISLVQPFVKVNSGSSMAAIISAFYTAPFAVIAKIQDDQADVMDFAIKGDKSGLSVKKTAEVLDKLLRKI